MLRRFRIILPVIGIVCLSALRAEAGSGPAPAALPGMGGKNLCKENFESYPIRLRKNADDAAAWQELRACSDILKRWNEAGLIAQDAIDRGVKRPEPHLLLGLSFYHAKDYARAVDEFKESIRIKDDQALAYFQLGLAYLHLSQPDEAVKAGVRATELDPSNPAYHHQLAFSYFSTHEDDKCEAEAKKALELDANDIAAYKILSNLYTRQGHPELAGKMTEESIHANGRVAAANPFVPDKRVAAEEIPQPFEPSTPPSDTEMFLKAQWNKMKQKALAGDSEAAASFYSTEGGTKDIYRESFQRMGSGRMHEVFTKLGDISDCDFAANSATASCRCPVTGSNGTILETKVTFEKNADHTWRIKSF